MAGDEHPAQVSSFLATLSGPYSNDPCKTWKRLREPVPPQSMLVSTGCGLMLNWNSGFIFNYRDQIRGLLDQKLLFAEYFHQVIL